MDYILKFIATMILILMITKLVMIAASQFKIVEFFEELWKKIHWVFSRNRK